MTKKTSVTQSIRATSLFIITTIFAFGYQSIRQLAGRCELSKSSVHRHLQAYERRNQYPESYFWESGEGSAFLRRLYCAVLYQFGLKHHVGADQLSEFFRLIRIHTHVGVSASALRQQMRDLEQQLATFQQDQEALAHCPEPERTVAMDETFFSQMMVLVLMDLPSQYILLEEPAADRSYETWKAHTCSRLETLGLTVRHAVSDRAKALIKLALNGFECQAGADLFHAQYDLSRWLSLPLGRATKTLAEELEKVRKQLEKHQKKARCDTDETHRLETEAKQAEQAHQDCLDAQTAYRQHQQAISDIVHPFDPASGLAQDQSTVLTALQCESEAIEALAEARLISDRKGYLKKFRKQLDDLSQHVGVWWLWIHTLLADTPPEPRLNDWIVYRMMPVIYWHGRLEKAKKKEQRQLYQRAWKKAQQRYQDDPLTQTLSEAQVQQWRLWCENKVKHFQRTSSAVEGRNGCLAQLYHNGRGLTPARLKALTVIHNYGIRQPD
ncbi:MAG: DUF6399 domain-containing protein, partial [Endozoicomonas sp.]